MRVYRGRGLKPVHVHQLELRGSDLYCDDQKVEYAGNGAAIVLNGVITAAVKLTLPLVEALLERNEDNRAMSADGRRKLENSILNNGVIYSPEQGIGISETWVLLNGQHRLEAIRRCWGNIPGEPIIQLSMGEKDAAYETIDRQRKRNLSDALRKPQYETSVLKNVAQLSSKGWDPLTVTKAMYNVIDRHNAVTPFNLEAFNFKMPARTGSYDDVKTGVLLYCLYTNDTYWMDHLQEILTGAALDNDQAVRLHDFWRIRSAIVQNLHNQVDQTGKGRPHVFFSHIQDIMNTFLTLDHAAPADLYTNYTGSEDFHKLRDWIKDEMEIGGNYSF